MVSPLGRTSSRRRIEEIQGIAGSLLRRIEDLIAAHQINPWTRVRLSPDDPPVPLLPRAARIGVFPLSANPLHWGHLLSGLAVMAQARLDKIVYIVALDSPQSEDLYPEEMRREAAAEAIALFQPLFVLAPGSAAKTLSGPLSFFRFLGLNGQQRLEAVYISGHECSTSTSMRETLDALQNNGAAHNERMHTTAVAHLEPNAASKPASPDRRALAFPSPLPAASAVGIRAALRSPVHRDELAFLPACVFRHLRVLSAFD